MVMPFRKKEKKKCLYIALNRYTIKLSEVVYATVIKIQEISSEYDGLSHDTRSDQ